MIYTKSKPVTIQAAFLRARAKTHTHKHKHLITAELPLVENL